MRLFVLLLVLLCCCAQEAKAKVIPWKQDVITYSVKDPALAKAAGHAERAWNKARVGIKFKRVYSRPDFKIVLDYSHAACGAESTVGYRHYAGEPLSTHAGPSCGRYNEIIIMTHEFGHVLGLHHDDSKCSIMNNGRYLVVGPLVKPSSCPVKKWYQNPVTKYDKQKARRLYQ